MHINKAAFFDRDGTLIKNVPYLSNIIDIQLIDVAINICKLLQSNGFKLFVVTNQSGVGRNFFDEKFVEDTNREIAKRYASYGIYFEKFYVCPHHPTDAVKSEYKKKCLCRKPKPGMLYRAAYEYNLDLSISLMIGDSASDLEAGRAAGCTVFNIASFLGLSSIECARLLECI